MATTPNFGLSKPSKGTTSWHIPLNANADISDRRFTIVDLDGNRSNYTANDNQLFVASDTGTVYRGDGTAWASIGDLNFDPSTILAGDLGFDPATQTELNTHIGATDAHHTRPTATEMRNAVKGDVDAADLTSGASTDAQVLTSDGLGGAAWEALPATITHDNATETISAAWNFTGGLNKGGNAVATESWVTAGFSANTHTHDSRYIRADTTSKTTGNLYIDNHAFGGTAAIALAVGDTDSGLHATADGIIQMYSDNSKIGHWSPSEVDITGGILKEGGNRVAVSRDGSAHGIHFVSTPPLDTDGVNGDIFIEI